jgi:hypothetical protein
MGTVEGVTADLVERHRGVSTPPSRPADRGFWSAFAEDPRSTRRIGRRRQAAFEAYRGKRSDRAGGHGTWAGEERSPTGSGGITYPVATSTPCCRP